MTSRIVPMAPAAGFSLIELIVVVAIMGILAAIAAPNFNDFVKSSRLASEANELMTDLAYARAESARQGKRLTICISSNGTSCSAGTNWAVGRIIFVDEVSAGTVGSVDSGEAILRVTQGSTGNNVAITASGFSNTTYIQYRPTGAITSSTNGSFKICDNRTGSVGRTVSVLLTGRAAVTSTTTNCP